MSRTLLLGLTFALATACGGDSLPRTPSADAGQPLGDAAAPPADAGQPLGDAAAPPADAGQPVGDAAPEDSGPGADAAAPDAGSGPTPPSPTPPSPNPPSPTPTPNPPNPPTPTPDTCGHSECSVGPALADDCNSCVAIVCAADPFCCIDGWDPACIWQSDELCATTCPSECGNFYCQAGETIDNCYSDCWEPKI